MDKFLVRKRPAADADAADGAKAAKAAPAPLSEEVDALRLQITDEGWRSALDAEFRKAYFATLATKLLAERERHKVFPPPGQVFAAFNTTPLDQVRVVILGQDPYHNDGQAHGLSFSVPHGIAVPPSLKNIYKELSTDVPGFEAPKHGNLEGWAKQGVLLLNATLTVRAHSANSHADFGWQQFTDAAIRVINERKRDVVFILWGGFAQKKGKIVARDRHCVLAAAHPSPLSVTKFLGCQVFSQANAYLEKKGTSTIQWQLEALPAGGTEAGLAAC